MEHARPADQPGPRPLVQAAELFFIPREIQHLRAEKNRSLRGNASTHPPGGKHLDAEVSPTSFRQQGLALRPGPHPALHSLSPPVTFPRFVLVGKPPTTSRVLGIPLQTAGAVVGCRVWGQHYLKKQMKPQLDRGPAPVSLPDTFVSAQTTDQLHGDQINGSCLR